MKAMYCTEPFSLEMRDDDIGQLKPDDVVIETAYCGICPWDIRAFSGKKKVPLPRVLGHEASGRVAYTGEAVDDLPEGTRVVADFIEKCGVCAMCRKGRSNKCMHPKYLKGGFAQYVKIPRKNVFPLQSTTSLKAAALTEPLACVVRGQKMLLPGPGKAAVVIGTGPIGLLHLQAASAWGAKTIAVDIIDERLETARLLGADYVVHSARDNLKDLVNTWTDGLGADAVVITVPSTSAVSEGIELLAAGGRLNIFAGIYPQDNLVVDPNIIHYKEISILGSADSTTEDFSEALTLIESGLVKTEPLISHMVPLDRLHDGFDIVMNRGGMKVLAEISGG